LKFTEFKHFGNEVYNKLNDLGSKSTEYQSVEMNLNHINEWSNDPSKFPVNENASIMNHYTRDSITLKVDTAEAYKSRMYISRAPI